MLDAALLQAWVRSRCGPGTRQGPARLGADGCAQGVSEFDYLSKTVEIPGAAGARMKEGTTFTNPRAVAFIRWLKGAWPLGVPLVVTRSSDDPMRQASVMLRNFRRNGGGAPADYPPPGRGQKGPASWPGGVRYLYGLYANDDIIHALLKAPQTAESWGYIIKQYMARGQSLSDHLAGNAVDIRCWNMSAADRVKVKSVIEAANPGLKVVIESDHIHVENLDLFDAERHGQPVVPGSRPVAAPSVVISPPRVPGPLQDDARRVTESASRVISDGLASWERAPHRRVEPNPLLWHETQGALLPLVGAGVVAGVALWALFGRSRRSP